MERNAARQAVHQGERSLLHLQVRLLFLKQFPRPSHKRPPRQSLLFRLLLCSPQKQSPRRRRKRSRQSRLRKYTDRAVRKALKIRKLALPDRE